jgi:hypothetical protein
MDAAARGVRRQLRLRTSPAVSPGTSNSRARAMLAARLPLANNA